MELIKMARTETSLKYAFLPSLDKSQLDIIRHFLWFSVHKLYIDLKIEALDHFNDMCKRHVISATNSSNHFSFWNRVGACFYCMTLRHNVPITLLEIIEMSKKISRDRLFKIGKNILIEEIGENITMTIPHRVAFIKRLFSEEPVLRLSKRKTDDISISRDIEQVDKDLPDFDLKSRLIVVYMLFTTACPNDFKEKLESEYFEQIKKACVFFGVARTNWLDNICNSYKNST